MRHGRTEWNAAGRMQGQANSNLDALGRRQAEAHGRLLARLGVDALYASPLDRTRQTAEIIARYVPLPVTFVDRIKEWDCGDWSGHLYAEVEARWPDEWRAYRADRFNYRGPNCENYPDMIARAEPFLSELLASPAENIAVISHGMIGRVMVSLLAGHDEKTILSYHQPNDVVFRVTASRLGHGEVAHYVEGRGPFEGIAIENRDMPHFAPVNADKT